MRRLLVVLLLAAMIVGGASPGAWLSLSLSITSHHGAAGEGSAQ